MKSVKISKYKADQIANAILAKAKEANETRKKELGELIKKVVTEQMPPDLHAIHVTYPSALRKLESIEISKLTPFKNSVHDHVYIYLPACPNPIAYTQADIYALIDLSSRRDQVRKLATEIIETKKNSDTLMKQISCTVHDLGTSSKLKHEFPEAYDAFTKLTKETGTGQQPKSSCDSVENLRANLSKIA